MVSDLCKYMSLSSIFFLFLMCAFVLREEKSFLIKEILYQKKKKKGYLLVSEELQKEMIIKDFLSCIMRLLNMKEKIYNDT